MTDLIKPKLPSVLLVDDDSTTNFLNKLLLQTLNVTDQVLVAHNGEEALMLLAEHCTCSGPDCPALILLDINMPVMNGIEFLEAYQPLPPAPPIVIVMLTTTTSPSDLDRLQTLPHAALLSKPLTKEKVEDLLQQHFNGQFPTA